MITYDREAIQKLAQTEAVQTLAALTAFQRLLIDRGMVTHKMIIETMNTATVVIVGAIVETEGMDDATARASEKINAWIATGER